MRLPGKLSLITFAVLISALLLLTLALRSRAPLSFAPLPSPNGYDDLVAAGNLVTDELINADEMPLEPLRAFVATNAEAVRLLELGLSRTCNVPMVVFITNQTLAMTELAVTKRIAQFNRALGRLAELEGRTNDAVQIYLRGFTLSDELSRGGFLIHGLVGIACEAIAFNRLTNLTAKLNATDTTQIIADLEKFDATAATWDEFETGERLFMSHMSQQSYNPVEWFRNWWTARASLEKAKLKYQQRVGQRRRFIVELALHRYAAEKGKPPAQLTELIPDYLPRIPKNPVDGQLPHYQVRDPNWQLDFKP